MADITTWHAQLDIQLSLAEIKTIDVASDGNCLFRAMSFGLVNHKMNYELLHASAAHIRRAKVISYTV